MDTTFICSMVHYEITIGNDVPGDVHCDIIIMGHDIDMGTYHHAIMHTEIDVARTLIDYVLLSPIMIFLYFVLVKSLIIH